MSVIESVMHLDKPVLIRDKGKSLVKIVPVSSSEKKILDRMYEGTGEIRGDIISPAEGLKNRSLLSG